MVNIIEEALYRWSKEGWSATKNDIGQHILTHARARPVVCGPRTQFQTIGMIQGEMQRALKEGPRPVVPETIPEPIVNSKKPKKKKSRGLHTGDAFMFDQIAPSRRLPMQPYRKSPPISETLPTPIELTTGEQAAWEFALLLLKDRQTDPDLIPIMERRFQTDASYRSWILDDYHNTSPQKIAELRNRVAAAEDDLRDQTQ